MTMEEAERFFRDFRASGIGAYSQFYDFDTVEQSFREGSV